MTPIVCQTWPTNYRKVTADWAFMVWRAYLLQPYEEKVTIIQLGGLLQLFKNTNDSLTTVHTSLPITVLIVSVRKPPNGCR